MEVIETLQITNVLHEVSNILLIPTIAVLLILIVYAIWSIGSIIVEVIRERRDYRAHIPALVSRLEGAPMEELNSIIDKSGLLTRQKDDAKELVSYLYLSEEARIEVAKRLLASSNMQQQRVVRRSEIASRIAPMVGLMGTLIPLGPGIVALGSGDLETLSNSLLIAFDTTIVGLATAVVCFIIARIRKGWYSDYNVSMEAVFNTLLERGQKAHEEGYKFDRTIYQYDDKGKTAVAISLDSENTDNNEDSAISGMQSGALESAQDSMQDSTQDNIYGGIKNSAQETETNREGNVANKTESSMTDTMQDMQNGITDNIQHGDMREEE